MEKQLQLPYQRPGNRRRTFTPATVFSFGLLLACSTLSASPYQQSLQVTAAAEFDSNPEMLETDEEGVSRAILRPDYQFRWVQAENELLAQARLNIERSSDTQLSGDREDPLLSLQWTGANPRGELRLKDHSKRARLASANLMTRGRYLQMTPELIGRLMPVGIDP